MKKPFQIDRFISLKVVKPIRKYFPANDKSQLVILMYHSISDKNENEVAPFYRLRTRNRQFEEQLTYLHLNGYNVLPLEQAIEKIVSKTLHGRNVCITFDDGLLDFYTNAYPVLQKFKYSSTVFIPVEYINDRKLSLKGQEHLTWDQIAEMFKNNVTFGSHSMSHRKLDLLNEAELKRELQDSKEIMEKHLQTTVKMFSYPFAFPETNKEFIKTLKNILLKSGYTLGVTTKIGSVDQKVDTLFLNRIPINSSDDQEIFQAKLEGNYNWIHWFQYVSKGFHNGYK